MGGGTKDKASERVDRQGSVASRVAASSTRSERLSSSRVKREALPGEESKRVRPADREVGFGARTEEAYTSSRRVRSGCDGRLDRSRFGATHPEDQVEHLTGDGRRRSRAPEVRTQGAGEFPCRKQRILTAARRVDRTGSGTRGRRGDERGGRQIGRAVRSGRRTEAGDSRGPASRTRQVKRKRQGRRRRAKGTRQGTTRPRVKRSI